MIRILLLLALWPSLAAAQLQEEHGARWSTFQPFTGTWKGTGTGQWGDSEVELECRFILNGRFLEMRARIAYAGSHEGAAGAVHEQLAIVSYDGYRETFTLREFHGAGLVLEAVLDSVSAANDATFTADSLENASPGWRARVTYQMADRDELIYRFDMAPPGKDFEPQTVFRLERLE